MTERIIAYPGGEGNAWADAREYIVRCRDCNWFFPDDLYGDACRWFCRENDNPDGFCAWGEKKAVS